jgi:hypothetical protein
VDRVWVTEAIRPACIACSHHLGRWRLPEHTGASAGPPRWRRSSGPGPGSGACGTTRGAAVRERGRDSKRVWWEDAGVHQNLTFPVHPDPVSGQHCWHQKVRALRPPRKTATGTSSSTPTGPRGIPPLAGDDAAGAGPGRAAAAALAAARVQARSLRIPVPSHEARRLARGGGARTLSAVLGAPRPRAAGPSEALLAELQLVPGRGVTPPAFALPDLDGRVVSLASLRGRVVCSTSGPRGAVLRSRAALDHEPLQRRYGTRDSPCSR